jgi:hypothetical protein
LIGSIRQPTPLRARSRIAFSISRRSAVRLRQVCAAPGSRGCIVSHSAPVGSVGYRLVRFSIAANR